MWLEAPLSFGRLWVNRGKWTKLKDLSSLTRNSKIEKKQLTKSKKKQVQVPLFKMPSSLRWPPGPALRCPLPPSCWSAPGQSPAGAPGSSARLLRMLLVLSLTSGGVEYLFSKHFSKSIRHFFHYFPTKYKRLKAIKAACLCSYAWLCLSASGSAVPHCWAARGWGWYVLTCTASKRNTTHRKLERDIYHCSLTNVLAHITRGTDPRSTSRLFCHPPSVKPAVL